MREALGLAFFVILVGLTITLAAYLYMEFLKGLAL